jgi:hypothetical protein
VQCSGYLRLNFYTNGGVFISGVDIISPAVQQASGSAQDEREYTRVEVFGTAPSNAFGVRGIIGKFGTVSLLTSSRVHFIKPDLRELLGPDKMPPFDVGAIGPTTTAGTAANAMTQVVSSTDQTGFVLDLSTLQAASKNGPAITPAAACPVRLTVTAQINGSASGGSSTLTASLRALPGGKVDIVNREVMTLASGESRSQTVTLTATLQANAGETITPQLWLTRTRFGVGVGNTTDSATLLEWAVEAIKR